MYVCGVRVAYIFNTTHCNRYRNYNFFYLCIILMNIYLDVYLATPQYHGTC